MNLYVAIIQFHQACDIYISPLLNSNISPQIIMNF